jgi:hypothetical protein
MFALRDFSLRDFSLTERKKNTQLIINRTQQFLYKITGDDVTSGFILALCHWLITLGPLVYLCVGPVNLGFYIFTVFLYVIVALHFYFNGCILVRIERHLWQTSQWWGPWMFIFTPLEYLGLPMTNVLARRIINGGIVLITLIIITKIL